MTATCLGPDPQPHTPRFSMPAGACDTHAHVFAAEDVHPFVAERSYTPPPATLESYKAMHRALGIERAVIVNPSVYGTDNRVTIAAIAGYGSNARGVAVVDETITDRELEDLHDAGIRGLRLNLLFGGGIGLQSMESLSERIADMGWHLQLLLDAQVLPDIASRLRGLKLPVVVDHMGHMNVSHGIDHPGFQTLIELVREGRCWVKLSGNYRISSAGRPYSDAIPFARALIEANSEHMLWGSDWPHPALNDYMPNDGDLLDALDDYAPEPDLKQRILVDNPASLYGL